MIAANLVVDEKLLGLLGEGRPSRLAPSSWMNLILRPSTPPAALICSNGELLGFDRAGFRDRHRTGGRMQDADGDFSIGYPRARWC